jgi:hypothetical protein
LARILAIRLHSFCAKTTSGDASKVGGIGSEFPVDACLVQRAALVVSGDDARVGNLGRDGNLLRPSRPQVAFLRADPLANRPDSTDSA